jgi:hypothetical protein
MEKDQPLTNGGTMAQKVEYQVLEGTSQAIQIKLNELARDESANPAKPILLSSVFAETAGIRIVVIVERILGAR